MEPPIIITRRPNLSMMKKARIVKNQVDRADADRGGQRGLGSNKILENAGRVVVDRVDARNLVEEGDEKRQKDRLEVAPLEKGDVADPLRLGERLINLRERFLRRRVTD